MRFLRVPLSRRVVLSGPRCGPSRRMLSKLHLRSKRTSQILGHDGEPLEELWGDGKRARPEEASGTAKQNH